MIPDFESNDTNESMTMSQQPTETSNNDDVLVQCNVIPPVIITDYDELLQYGIVSKVPIVSDEIPLEQWEKWANEYTVVTPEIMAAEGDNTYAFYRNILDEPDFPFDSILVVQKRQLQPPEQHTSSSIVVDDTTPINDTEFVPTAIGQAILDNFPITSLDEIRLDDAFCIHYTMDQADTTGAKHMDPSDITINICLQKSKDCTGSQVLFYGTKQLNCNTTTTNKNDAANEFLTITKNESYQFLVNPEPGYATIHWGSHPHETTKLNSGIRTNIVLTYCYKDKSRSDVAGRTCYI